MAGQLRELTHSEPHNLHIIGHRPLLCAPKGMWLPWRQTHSPFAGPLLLVAHFLSPASLGSFSPFSPLLYFSLFCEFFPFVGVCCVGPPILKAAEASSGPYTPLRLAPPLFLSLPWQVSQRSLNAPNQPYIQFQFLIPPFWFFAITILPKLFYLGF